MENIKPEGRLSFLTYKSDNGGVGYIRTILPSIILNSWRYNKMTFESNVLSNFVQDPNFYKTQAFVKFQRSATKDQLEMLKFFKQNFKKQTGTPILYEIDDLLFDIPESNFASSYYKENKPYVEEMLSMVDGITVSTSFLMKKYLKYNKNISIVPNRLGKCLWGEIKDYAPHSTGKLKIVYPGSQNHFSIKGMTEEGGDFGKTLINYIHGTKKDRFEWIFVGGIPEDFKNDNQVTYYEWIDYMSYPRFLKNLNVDIGIAPLEINDFNKAKSNLKMLEYVACGIPGVYTDIEPYKNATLKGKTEEDLINHIENLSKDENLRLEVSLKDRKALGNNLFLEDNRLNWINEHLSLWNKRIK